MASDDLVIREGRREDCEEIRRLIQELADFEEMSFGPQIDAATLEKDGFDTNPPLFGCFVAEIKQSAHSHKSGKVHLAGYAVYYYAYSTWRGKKMYLEDLIISEAYRRRKIGSTLFKRVAKKGVETGCAHVEFSVLSWNPARAFYEKMGCINFTELEQWHFYRLSHEDMLKVANEEN